MLVFKERRSSGSASTRVAQTVSGAAMVGTALSHACSFSLLMFADMHHVI